MQKNRNDGASILKRVFSISEIGLLISFLVIFIFFSVSSKYFFTVRNLSNILGQISLPLIAAVGLLVLVTRRVPLELPTWSWRVPAYGIGTVAAYWTIERIVGFWG